MCGASPQWEENMKYPYGYCGMPCALCSRYRTNGKSRCAGCSDDGFYTDVCKVHRCVREKQLEHCGSCQDFPCTRLGKMGDFRDLETGGAKLRTCTAVNEYGIREWYAEYEQRAEMLTTALERYNDGRMKRYLCELFIQNDAAVLHTIMTRAETLTGTAKECGKAFRELAEALRCIPKE